MDDRKLTEEEYKVLRDLYHNFNEAFHSLPNAILLAYYGRLYEGK